MRNTLGPKGLWRGLKREWPYIVRHLPDTPRLLLSALQAQSSDGSCKDEQRWAQLDARFDRQTRELRFWRWFSVTLLVGLVGFAVYLLR